MADPGILSSQIPPGEDHVMRRIADLERAVREMRAADILGTAGLTAAPNLLTVNGALVVDGSETVNGPLAVHDTAAFDGATTIGGTLGVTGPTTLGAPTTVSGSLGVSGPMTVSGTLSLPAGIINNAALTSPLNGQVVSATSVFSQATNLGAGLTLTRPSWASHAYIAGAAVCNSNTFTYPGKTIYWQVDTSPISSATNYPQSKTIAYVSTVDSVPLFGTYTVWPTVLTVGSAPTLYVAPISLNAMAGTGSISITFAVFVVWF